ncbi:integrase catalytic domain-containing protein [Peristeroidobacter soli]|uniref:integrase catalytic domain-containing protein n=1 Tax=Peristeroidobacter soli TaxID=2497877 RepID=UPI00101E2085|nr:DDE-type integrase/transposase/recombinase [Peristeroidobacter soli]
MGTTMTHTARAELTHVVRRRYGAASGAEKRKILDEFIAATGYHEKSAIRALNAKPTTKRRQTRSRPSLYDEAAGAVLIVLWEASDRVCGKRLRALLPILLPALERNGHLHLGEAMRQKILAMSASTIDRLLRVPRSATRLKKARRAMPAARRRVPVRTFADWNEPPPGSMEMDLVAHCGDANCGSYVNSLVMTDIASGWTEAAPLVVRESGLVVETLDCIRQALLFALRALDVDNGSEFVNESLIKYCLSQGIELTRSRPWRKNDQAWIEQKNGAVVRKLLGYRRFQGIAAAQVITRLYGAARLFVNFFQPSFKLAEKHRQGAQVSKRYHPPQTPCERLLQAENLSETAKAKLREVAGALDPLKLLEEIRAVQAHLVTLADGGHLPSTMPEPPDLAGFVASLSSAWRAGEIRPTFSVEAKPRYLRSLQTVALPVGAQTPKNAAAAATVIQPLVQTPPAISPKPILKRPQLIYAEPGKPVYRAFTMIWPLVCRRLEGFPNITSAQLFDELCVQFPGRFHPKHVNRLAKLVKQWRQDARARGVMIPRPKYRRFSNNPRGRGRTMQSCTAHWSEMLQWMEEHPDQTAAELLVEFQARYPGLYNRSHLRTLRRRLQIWRREAIQRLICGMQDHTQDVSSAAAV